MEKRVEGLEWTLPLWRGGSVRRSALRVGKEPQRGEMRLVQKELVQSEQANAFPAAVLCQQTLGRWACSGAQPGLPAPRVARCFTRCLAGTLSGTKGVVGRREGTEAAARGEQRLLAFVWMVLQRPAFDLRPLLSRLL